MRYALQQDGIVLAWIEATGADMFWVDGTFQRTEAFAEVEPLFIQELELLEAPDLDADAWEAIWREIHGLGVRLVPEDGSGPIEEFAMHVEGDTCRFRY